MISLTRLTIQRARKERLPQVAGSLAFTTVLAVVPLTAVCFALFMHFPMFYRLEEAIEDKLLSGLLPAGISRTVVNYLGDFAANANGRLTWVGLLFLLGTAVALLMTIENALNQIWEVRRPRPILKRVGLYLLMLSFGPPILGASLWATSWVLGESMGLFVTLPPELTFVLTLGPALMGCAAMTALFYYVPNTPVLRRDAIFGGLLAGIAFELGKRGFAAWLVKVPTYKTVYGAFAAVPAFLLWTYFSWLVTLSAALVAANLGKLRRRPAAR
jgi:membrane protein